MARAHVGCSGWMYKDWRGIVYPERLPMKRWFEHYSTMFDTVEINNTFYRLPPAQTVEAWAAQAPPGFVYAIKLGQFGSHRVKLRDAESWMPNHLDRAERFGASLGPTLVQLPPRWKRNAERLDEFLSVAPTTMRWAVELRDPSWVHDEVFSVLQRHGAALCIHDLLPDHPWELTTDWTFIRFHHGTRGRNSNYSERELEEWAERIEGWAAQADVYVYFNNDWNGYAVRNGLWLRRRLGV